MDAYQTFLTEMEQHYQDLTGVPPSDSGDIGIRLKVLAGALASLQEKLDLLEQKAFPHTALGEALDLHAQVRGVTRKPALKAQGILEFSRQSSSSQDLILPKGMICCSASEQGEGRRFLTTEQGVLLAGKRSVSVRAEAAEGGKAYNHAAGTVTVMITPAQGIASVTNPKPFLGGEDPETDGSLRERLFATYRQISNGTNAAFYQQLAMTYEGIQSVWVAPRKRGRGTVDLYLSGYGTEPSAELLRQMEKDFAQQKELQVDILLKAAKSAPQPVSVAIEPAPGYTLQEAENACKRAVQALFSRLKVGEDLLLGALGQAIWEAEGVYNYRIVTPRADVSIGEDQIARLGTLTISRKEALV